MPFVAFELGIIEMQRVTFSAALLSFVLFALCLPLVPADAYAAPGWNGKPGNGYGRNKPPTIEGTPSTTAKVDQYYSFQAQAADPDGDTLRFSITNKPTWAAFDTARGFLSGFPQASDAGSVTRNIVISVSDGKNTASLAPFSITVLAAPNSPPVIGGSPAGEVVANQPYSFSPTATDADGDPLQFSVANKPGWAAFETSSGKLSGTPADADVGVYENIRITVTDGMASDSTDPFAITVVQTTNGGVTLSWTAPTENEDGSLLTDLAGFRIYYGTASGQYAHEMEIGSPGILTAVIENLSPGTWYFAATAFTAAGLESALSNEVQRAIP